MAWWILRRSGWDIRGLYPDSQRLILIAAPHSSYLDWYWGMLTQWALGVKFSFLIKSAFFVPPLGWFMRWLGGISVNRKRIRGVLPEMLSLFSGSEPRVLLITPEGQTKPVARLKRGFYQIALSADLPVFVISFRYEERVISLDGYVDLTGGFEAVEERLKIHYRHIRGRHRGYLNDLSMRTVVPLTGVTEPNTLREKEASFTCAGTMTAISAPKPARKPKGSKEHPPKRTRSRAQE